ncbi:MAG TPA: hypothetical protein VN213_22090 [Solirubrobacteraceae bacterium]|nr:hypothetical protein [Solirubrobacteraceae bacterium]
MSDALPDEVVEAMARALEDDFLRREMPLGGQASPPPPFDLWVRYATVALAALPAGLYRSNGKGKVTPLPADETLTQVHRLWREDHERLQSQLREANDEVDRGTNLLMAALGECNAARAEVDQLRAALSATDAEEHRDE